MDSGTTSERKPIGVLLKTQPLSNLKKSRPISRILFSSFGTRPYHLSGLVVANAF